MPGPVPGLDALMVPIRQIQNKKAGREIVAAGFL
jgi:hypothetical protein